MLTASWRMSNSSRSSLKSWESAVPKSRGREGTPAETVMRLMILKHIRNWSYVTLEREVRANLVYRNFTRVGAGKMPDAKTMGRWGSALGPEPIKQFHKRMVKIAQTNNVVEGRRMRADTKVTETNIHYPTDSSLLGDGVRVLIRTMKKVTKIAGDVGTKLRDRSRAVKLRTLDVARAARSKAKQSRAKESLRKPTVSYSIQPVGWLDKQKNLHKRLPKASSMPQIH